MRELLTCGVEWLLISWTGVTMVGEEAVEEDCKDESGVQPVVEMMVGVGIDEGTVVSAVVLTAMTVGACCKIVASELGIIGTS